MLSFFRKKLEPKPIESWRTTAFTPGERAAIEGAFQPLGDITAETLTDSLSPNTLGNLVGHLKKEHLRHLGYRILERADSLVTELTPLIDRHFYSSARGDFYYRWRNHDPSALDEAVKSFQCQVALGAETAKLFLDDKNLGFVPAHAGYRQLRIIEEKRGNWASAKALCEQAKAEGWADDWDHHIARIDKKQAKGKA